MFDELLSQLQRLEGSTSIPVQVSVDDDGYYDRECPGEECRASFKVLFSDWRDTVADDHVYCPICRHDAAGTEWNTAEQLEHLKAAALAHLGGIVNRALRKDAEEFNRRQPKGGFVSLSMSYRAETPAVIVPPDAAEIMRQNHRCEDCGCRFATIGAAFFCPACGASSAERTFVSDIETAIRTVENLPVLRAAIISAGDRDSAENTCRLILENTQGSLVGIFQHYVEAMYARMPQAVRARRNAFQNLAEGSKLWKDATGTGYDSLLTPSKYEELQRFVQQRHLIVHQGGVVDADYLARTGDPSYTQGQRLVVKADSVLRLAALVHQLGQAIATRVP